jgi:Domain of unknown function (DUF1906)
MTSRLWCSALLAAALGLTAAGSAPAAAAIRPVTKHGPATHGAATHGAATHGAATHGAARHGAAVQAAARPGPLRTVRYAGISLRVPARWPVIRLARHPQACPRLNVHAVYLGTPGPDPRCPADLQGRTTAVQIEPVSLTSPDLRQATRRVTIGGRPARTNPDAAVTHTITDILPSAGAEVSLAYGVSPALADFVQSTIRLTGPATAQPAQTLTPAAIAPAAAQGIVRGPGFDTCAAPSVATMRDWLASPYRAVGIYIGGVDRACSQASLTSGWITSIQRMGWHYFPLYVGLQAPCVAATGDATIQAGSAAAEGRAAADDAVTQAADLGIPASTPVIYDMEAYSGGCAATVTAFLSAWDAELHARGYVAGVYESFSNVHDLASASGSMTEPDIIHYADWDGQATTASPYMPHLWLTDQRIHQYSGGHNASYGGATLNIDNDQLDVALSGLPRHGQVRPAFRIAVGVNANGSAEWFARAANGTVRHNYQHPVSSPDWSATRAVGQSPADLASNPAVVAESDGRLTMFARADGGQIVHAWQQDGAPNGWHWAGAVGSGSAPGPAVADPGAVRGPGGTVMVFATTTTGAVAVTRQDQPGDDTGWSAWASLDGSCAGTPVPAVTGSRVEVACVTTGGGLAVDTLAGNTWSGWKTVAGGPGHLAGTPSVVAISGGPVEALVTVHGGGLAYAWQDPASGTWTWGSSPTGNAAVRNSPSAVPWPGGGVAVFAQQRDGQLGYAVQQSGGGGTWAAWTALPRHMLGSPEAWINADGGAEVALLDKRLQIAVATYGGSAWSGWGQLGGGY